MPAKEAKPQSSPTSAKQATSQFSTTSAKQATPQISTTSAKQAVSQVLTTSAKQATPQVPANERVQASYRQLTIAATSLNAASDELGKAINLLDAALKDLNLGISAWIKISGDTDPLTGQWWSRDIGYAKIRDKWCLALRNCSGDYNFPPGDTVEEWSFNDGPRWLRAEAVVKIPDLLEALLKRAQDVTKQIKDRTAQAHELIVAINQAARDAHPAEQESEGANAKKAE